MSNMTIDMAATTLVRATEIFIDFFERVPDMTNKNDVRELLGIQCDVCYAIDNVMRRNEK